VDWDREGEADLFLIFVPPFKNAVFLLLLCDNDSQSCQKPAHPLEITCGRISQPEFIDSLLKNKEPTLIFNSRNYRPDFRLTLPSLFPLHFPFGHGGIEEDRRTHVSTEECLKHYLKISLPRFQHADIILVISHMYYRKKVFSQLF
jgi:hypothetical protein